MLNKYVVEIETETGYLAVATTQIAAVFSNDAEVTLHLNSSPMIFIRYRNAARAAEAYTKIAAAIRAVA